MSLLALLPLTVLIGSAAPASITDATIVNSNRCGTPGSYVTGDYSVATFTVSGADANYVISAFEGPSFYLTSTSGISNPCGGFDVNTDSCVDRTGTANDCSCIETSTGVFEMSYNKSAEEAFGGGTIQLTWQGRNSQPTIASDLLNFPSFTGSDCQSGTTTPPPAPTADSPCEKRCGCTTLIGTSCGGAGALGICVIVTIFTMPGKKKGETPQGNQSQNASGKKKGETPQGNQSQNASGKKKEETPQGNQSQTASENTKEETSSGNQSQNASENTKEETSSGNQSQNASGKKKGETPQGNQSQNASENTKGETPPGNQSGNALGLLLERIPMWSKVLIPSVLCIWGIVTIVAPLVDCDCSKLETCEIVGIIIGCVALLCAVVSVVVFWCSNAPRISGGSFPVNSNNVTDDDKAANRGNSSQGSPSVTQPLVGRLPPISRHGIPISSSTTTTKNTTSNNTTAHEHSNSTTSTTVKKMKKKKAKSPGQNDAHGDGHQSSQDSARDEPRPLPPAPRSPNSRPLPSPNVNVSTSSSSGLPLYVQYSAHGDQGESKPVSVDYPSLERRRGSSPKV